MRELIRGIKEAKAMASPSRGDYVHADKIGAGVSGYFGYQNLRALWSMASLDENFNIYDSSGQGRTTTSTDVTSGLFNEKIPYTEYNGSTSLSQRADEPGLAITANLSLGTWVYFNSVAGLQTFIDKQADYTLYYTPNNFLFSISDTLGGLTTVTSSVVPVTGRWYKVVGFFTPNGDMGIWVNGVIDTISGPADIRTSGQPITLGNLLNGRMSWTFVSAATATTKQIKQHFDSTKTSFKVYE